MNIGDSEESQQIVALATRPDNLSSISRTNIVEVENHFSKVFFASTYLSMDTQKY